MYLSFYLKFNLLFLYALLVEIGLFLPHFQYLSWGVMPSLIYSSIAGMALLGCDVIVTDQKEVLPLLQRNVERNISWIMQKNPGLI